jgi:hypothetical protein
MKLSIKALALSCGILWGAAVFLVGIGHLIWPGYGTAMLELAASIYPGYSVGGFWSVIVGTLYALVDGAIAGAVLACLYNALLRTGATAAG